MKRNKKCLALLAVALTAGSLLPACGSSKGDASSSAAPAQSGKPTAKIPIEVMEIGWGTSSNFPQPANDFVKQKVDQALNTDIKLTLPATSEEFNQKLNLRAAGNDLPDLMNFKYKNNYMEYVNKGLLLDLTPYMDKLADVKNLVGNDVFERGKIEGKYYSVTLNPVNYYGVPWIRKDWLDKLGLPVPKTLDELIEVSKAFTERDPDGNGKKDTFGITTTLGSLRNLVLAQHGILDSFYLKDGQMVDGMYQPEMKTVTGYMKKIMDTGSVDPEMSSNKANNAQDKAFQGKAGIIITDWATMMKDEQVKKWKDANPQADWIMVGTMKGPGGDYLGGWDKSSTNGFLAISNAVGKDKAKLNKILEMLNYTSSGEGLDLVQFGLKDTHFKQENGKITLNADKMAEIGYTWVYQFAGPQQNIYLKTKFPNQASYIENNYKVKTMEGYGGYVTLPAEFNSADANRFKDEELLKFYYGKNKLEDFDAFLDKLNTTFKYKVYHDSAMKQLKELGFAK